MKTAFVLLVVALCMAGTMAINADPASGKGYKKATIINPLATDDVKKHAAEVASVAVNEPAAAGEPEKKFDDLEAPKDAHGNTIGEDDAQLMSNTGDDCKALPSEKKKACAKANANKVQKERAESGKKDYVRKASTSV